MNREKIKQLSFYIYRYNLIYSQHYANICTTKKGGQNMRYIETKKGLNALLKRTKEYGEKLFTKKDLTSMNSSTG